MMITRKALNRRTFLRGAGTAVALPFLDAMTPALSAATKAPVRMAFVYVPNGIDMRHWNPDYEGALKELKAEVTASEIKIDLAADVLFDFDKASIKKDAEPSLRNLATVLKANPAATVSKCRAEDGVAPGYECP